MSKSVNAITLRQTAKLALREERLNGLDGLTGEDRETEMQDALMAQLDDLVEMATEAAKAQQKAQEEGVKETLEGEVVDQ